MCMGRQRISHETTTCQERNSQRVVWSGAWWSMRALRQAYSATSWRMHKSQMPRRCPGTYRRKTQRPVTQERCKCWCHISEPCKHIGYTLSCQDTSQGFNTYIHKIRMTWRCWFYSASKYHCWIESFASWSIPASCSSSNGAILTTRRCKWPPRCRLGQGESHMGWALLRLRRHRIHCLRSAW